jgi:hypothetical protein
MSKINWSGPIVLAAAGASMYALLVLIVLGLTHTWQETVLVSGFALFGMIAMTYEVGHKVYWRLGRRLTFLLLFAVPTAIAALEYARRLAL